MSTKRKLEEHLIEEIEKTGYPLEIEITSILDEDNWYVLNQDYYLDEELNERRTIDMIASCMETFVKGGISTYEPLKLATDMVIECKKSSTHAWVFFTISGINCIPWFQGQTFEFLDVFPNVERKYSVISKLLPFSLDVRKEVFLHYDKFQRIAATFHEVALDRKAKRNTRREIFEASNQIVKYISYHLGNLYQYAEHIRKDSSFRLIRFYFPVIVFDGKMYECIIGKDKPKLIERNHILLTTYYRPKYSEYPLSYGIDVVKREHFSTFLKHINTDIQLIEERIVEEKDKILKSIDEFFEKTAKRKGTGRL